MRPIARLPETDTSLIDLYFDLQAAKDALQPFVFQSVFSDRMRAVVIPAQELLRKFEEILPTDLSSPIDWAGKIDSWRIINLKNAFRKFDAVLNAELQTSAIYYVSAKGGFDTVCLTDQGESLFPGDLSDKVPGAIADVRAGTRCLAFELPTAAGFHLHRANEAVLRAYFDAVAGSNNRPKTRNMGDYIKKLEQLGKGDAKVIDVLKSLKDLHRNPLMHPEDTLRSLDEALSLYAAIRAAVGYMLDRIPRKVSKVPPMRVVSE